MMRSRTRCGCGTPWPGSSRLRTADGHNVQVERGIYPAGPSEATAADVVIPRFSGLGMARRTKVRVPGRSVVPRAGRHSVLPWDAEANTQSTTAAVGQDEFLFRP